MIITVRLAEGEDDTFRDIESLKQLREECAKKLDVPMAGGGAASSSRDEVEFELWEGPLCVNDVHWATIQCRPHAEVTLDLREVDRDVARPADADAKPAVRPSGRRVGEPSAKRQLSGNSVWLEETSDTKKAREMNEQTLHAQKAQLSIVLAVKGGADIEYSGRMIRRNAFGGHTLPSSKLECGLFSAPVAPAAPLQTQQDVVCIAPAVVAAAMYNQNKQPSFEFELKAGESRDLETLHVQMCSQLSVASMQFPAGEKTLHLVAARAFDAGAADGTVRLFLGFVAPPSALENECERLWQHKIPLILDLDQTLGGVADEEFPFDDGEDVIRFSDRGAGKKMTVNKKLEQWKVKAASARGERDQDRAAMNVQQWEEAQFRLRAAQQAARSGKLSGAGAADRLRKFSHHWFSGPSPDLIFLRPHLLPFLQVAQKEFACFVVTAASQTHAMHFMRAIDSLDGDREEEEGELGVAASKYGAFLGGEYRMFADVQSKTLQSTTRTSTFSSLILDDCNKGEGVKEGQRTWPSDHSNVWCCEAFSPLVSAYDDDQELRDLCGEDGRGLLITVKREFFAKLEKCQQMMQQAGFSWYDAVSHEIVQEVQLFSGVVGLLGGEHTQYKHRTITRQRSRSASPTREGEDEKTIFIVPDVNAFHNQHQKIPRPGAGVFDFGRHSMGTFQLLFQKRRELNAKVFITNAVREELDLHKAGGGAANRNTDMQRSARDAQTWYERLSHSGFVQLQDGAECWQDCISSKGQRSCTCSQITGQALYKKSDHRIVVAAQKLQAGDRGHKCVILTGDKDLTAEARATREVQPVDVMKLTTLQRYMFNLDASDESSTLPLGCDVDTLKKFRDKPNIDKCLIEKWLARQGHEQRLGLPA
jgi:hypothetical protein